MELVIHVGARKHGISDASMLHAVRYELFFVEHEEIVIFIGPDISGNLIEVGLVESEYGRTIIHAMKAREKYLR